MSNLKRFSLSNELLYINIFSLFLVAVIAFGHRSEIHYLRIILGLPFVLFFPGYTLIATLFPKKNDLDGIERVALSFALNIAVVPLIGLFLNYTPWGIRLEPILISLIVFTASLSVIAYYRRRKIPAEECFFPAIAFNTPQWIELSRLDKILSLLLILAIVFSVGTICYVVVTPKVEEKFTEFYILGPEGKAEGYPRELSVGEKGQVKVGIVNHEYSPVQYYVKIVMDGFIKNQTSPVELEHEQKWENVMDFSASEPHEKLKVEFLLFREGDEAPYRSCHLWLDIVKKTNSEEPLLKSVQKVVYQ